MKIRLYFNTALGLFTKSLINLFIFLAGILLIRLLSKDDYGKYSYVSSIAGIFGVIINFGLNNYFIREMSREEENAKGHFAEFLGIQSALTLFVSGILVVISLFHHDFDLRYGILLFAAGLCVTSLGAPLMCYFAAKGRNDLVYWQMLLQAALQLGMTVIGKFYPMSLVFYMLIPFATGVGRLIHSLIDAKRLGWLAAPRFNFGTWKRLFIDSLPFGFFAGVNIIYTKVDVILFAHLQSNAGTAVYAASTKFAYLLVLIPCTFTENLFPVFSRRKEEEKELYSRLLEKFTFYNWALYLPIAVGGTFEAKGIIRLLLGERYLDTLLPFCIYLYLPLIIALYVAVNHYLIAFGKTWALVRSAVIGLVINFFANLIFLSYFHNTKALVASALITLFTEAVICLYSFSFLRGLGRFHFPLAKFMRVLVPLSLMLITLWILPFSNIFLRIPIGAVVYGLGIWFFGIVQDEDKTKVSEYLKSIFLTPNITKIE